MTPALNAAEFLLDGKPPDRIAIRMLDAAFTYGELQRASGEFASRLSGCGAGIGDRVILLSGNSFHWAAAYLGILRAGLVCVPLPVSIAAEDLAYVVATAGARLAFVQSGLAARHERLLAGAGIFIWRESAAAGAYFSAQDTEPLAHREPLPGLASAGLAALMFTSGSTGKPRGVMVSHRNIVANTASIVAALAIRDTDRMMTVLPFHYCFGTSLLHTYLKAGAMLVVDTRFSYPEVVLLRMQETECTGFAGVPSHYQILLRNSSIARRDFPHLRTLLQAGGHLAPHFLRQLQEALPAARIYVMYGQTEATARLSCLPPERLASKPGSIGKAIPGVTLRVLTESGCDAAPGELGEIVAEGDNIAQGYWNDPEETARSFRDGKLYTGDLATMDADGYLYVVDRAKEFIKCGGTRIGCRQMEDKLLECEELLEVAVVGVPDDVLGEAVRAFVVPRSREPNGVEQRLRLFCQAHLPHAYRPRDIVVVSALPKNSSGKIARATLKTMQIDVQGERSREVAAVEV